MMSSVDVCGCWFYYYMSTCEFCNGVINARMNLINEKNGGNNFKLPHTGLRKGMVEDGWDFDADTFAKIGR